MSEEIDPLECDHILYPVRDAKTLIHQCHECQVCDAQFAQLQLRDEFARIRQAAYERGKAEGVEEGKQAERVRVVPLLNARKQTAAVSETRAQQNNKPHIAIVYHNEVEVWDEAINIVNQE